MSEGSGTKVPQQPGYSPPTQNKTQGGIFDENRKIIPLIIQRPLGAHFFNSLCDQGRPSRGCRASAVSGQRTSLEVLLVEVLLVEVLVDLALASVPS